MNKILLDKCSELSEIFSLATGLETKVIDFSGQTMCCHFPDDIDESLCEHMPKESCVESHLFGAHQALKFGGSYTFFCPIGLVHFISPIVIESKLVGALLSGHILMTEPDVYLIKHVQKYVSSAKVMKNFVQNVKVYSPTKVRALSRLLKHLAGELSDGTKVSDKSAKPDDFKEAKHNHSIYKVINFINSNYMSKITLEQAAKEVFFTSQYLSKIFKEETGFTFKQYLNYTRIERSKALLKEDELPHSEIAYLVGFSDQSHFSRSFKKETGMSPKTYQFNCYTDI